MSFLSEWDDLALFVAASTATKLIVWWSACGPPLLPAGAVCVGRVSALHLYPVKSMSGLELTEAECTHTGLKVPGTQLHDRRWLVTVGDERRFVTARQRPQLLTTRLSLDVASKQLCIAAPSMDSTLRIPLQPDDASAALPTKVWGQSTCGWDCGVEAGAWLSRLLGEDGHRLLQNSGEVGLRNIDRKPHLLVNSVKQNDKLVYHDDGPFHVVNSASLDDLNRRLSTTVDEDGARRGVTMANFRPSIVVTGDAPAYDEDTWNELYIGSVKMTLLMPCARCMLPTIDPATGVFRKDGEPLKTLRSYRMIQSNNDSPCFGTYFVCDRQGSVRVGDAVYTYKRR